MNSLSFRIWFPLSMMFLIIMVLFGFFYSNRQSEIYTEYRDSEVQQIGKTLKNSLEEAIANQELQKIGLAISIAKNSLDFEAVLFDFAGEKKIVGDSTIDFNNLDKDKYFVHEFKVYSEFEPQGSSLVFVSSRENLAKSLESVNRPTYFALIVVVVFFVFAIILYTRILTRPFNEISSLSKSIRENNVELPDLKSSSITEVQQLQGNLIQLVTAINEKDQLKARLLEELKEELSEKNVELEQLSLVAKYTTNGVVITNEKVEIIWVNSAFEKLSGYELKEVKGKNPKMLQCIDTINESKTALGKKIRNREIVENFEILNQSKSGSRYWISLNIVPIFNDTTLIGFIAVQSDITERKNELLRVSESQKNLQELLNNSSELIHTLDLEGNLVWVNDSWMDKMKYDENQVIGKSIKEFLSASDENNFVSIKERLLHGEEILGFSCVLYNKQNEKVILKGKSIPLYKNDVLVGSQAYLQDITEIIKVQNNLSEKSALQELITRISSEYINLPVSQYFTSVRTSLELISKFFGADRAYVYNYNLNENYCEYTHEWVSNASLSQLQTLKRIDLNEMPFWLEQHKKNEFVIVEDAGQMEDEAVRTMLKSDNIKAIITIPINDEDELIGFVGFDLLNNPRSFSQDEKDLLRVYAQILLNLYKQLDFINELNSSKKEIEKINSSLEEKVAENTRRNIELSNNIVEQEKLATIGEISAGIAHDLNTPLGTIKVGADNVQYMLNKILSMELPSLRNEDFNFVENFIKSSQPEMFVGGMQLRKEIKAMQTYIDESYGEFEDKSQKLVELMVKARIQPSEKVILDTIINAENPLLLMELLYQMQVAKAQLETIKTASDKAVKVVQDVRAYIKGESSENERVKFNLRENIATVLGIFGYEINAKMNLVFEVDKEIQMVGYDVKLFQLWSNLIKNAFEAMEGQDKKYLGIISKVEGKKLTLKFENNGPKIPDEVKQNMFKKFYTTKAKKSGTGMGLSIVNNILKDHHANIEVYSDDELTQFIITFDIDG